MAIPQNIEELAHKVRTEIYGRDVREALASSMEATAEVAEWSREVAQQILDGAFDEAELIAEIENKLNQLEQDYAPKLTSLETEIEDARGGESNLGDRLNEFSSQLAQNAEETDQKIESVTTQLNNKRSIATKIKSSDLDTSTEANKIQPINVSDALMQMFSPAGTVSPVIPNRGVTREKVALEAVGLAELDPLVSGINNYTIMPKFDENGRLTEVDTLDGENIMRRTALFWNTQGVLTQIRDITEVRTTIFRMQYSGGKFTHIIKERTSGGFN